MKTLIFSVGIPGSGKTTYLKQLVIKTGYEYICPDDIRVELTGNMEDQSRNQEVWNIAYQRMAGLLDESKSVIFDATFSDTRNRYDLITLARKHGAKIIKAIYFNVDPGIAKARNKQRDRVISDDFIDKMNKRIQQFPPSQAEGIDEIIVLRN